MSSSLLAGFRAGGQAVTSVGQEDVGDAAMAEIDVELDELLGTQQNDSLGGGGRLSATASAASAAADEEIIDITGVSDEEMERDVFPEGDLSASVELAGGRPRSLSSSSSTLLASSSSRSLSSSSSSSSTTKADQARSTAGPAARRRRGSSAAGGSDFAAAAGAGSATSRRPTRPLFRAVDSVQVERALAAHITKQTAAKNFLEGKTSGAAGGGSGSGSSTSTSGLSSDEGSSSRRQRGRAKKRRKISARKGAAVDDGEAPRPENLIPVKRGAGALTLQRRLDRSKQARGGAVGAKGVLLGVSTAVSMGQLTPFEQLKENRRLYVENFRKRQAAKEANQAATQSLVRSQGSGDDRTATVEKDSGNLGARGAAAPRPTPRKRSRSSSGPPRADGNSPSSTSARIRLKGGWVDDGADSAFKDRIANWRKEAIARARSGASLSPDVNLESLSDLELASGSFESPLVPLFPDSKDRRKRGFVMPQAIYSALYPFQATGVRWMCELHNQRVGGIIGDEMGLGKTVQIATLLSTLHCSNRLKGGVLIVVPATVMQQWVMEIHEWWPPLRVCVLHDSGSVDVSVSKVFQQEERDMGYGDRSSSFKHNDAASRRGRKTFRTLLKTLTTANDTTAGSHPGVLLTTYAGVRLNLDLLLDYQWEYVILDEGHKIRNPEAAATVAVKQLETPHRIILTGTPIQNSLRELWSLFDFCFPGKLGTLPTFETEFSTPITHGGFANASEAQALAAYKCAVALRDLINPYLLRRLKKDVLKDEIPEQRERVLFCSLTEGQRLLYNKFLRSEELQSILGGQRNLLSGIDVLRKVCNHPDLLFLEKKTGEARTKMSFIREEDPPPDFGHADRSGKLQLLGKLLPAWCTKQGSSGEEDGSSVKREAMDEAGSGGETLVEQRTGHTLHKVLLFAQTRQMLDLIERYVSRDLRIPYVRMDGATPVGERMAMVEQFNESSIEALPLFLLSTRVGGLGLNLVSADRVIIVDPDWNPATDHQARERACRIGQQKEVSIFRLITGGTIEEKIYHRQIFKQMLTNKVLTDPDQNRFFKAGDLADLFSLGGEYADSAGDSAASARWVRPTRPDETSEDGGDSAGKSGADKSASPAPPSERNARVRTETEKIFGHRVAEHKSLAANGNDTKGDGDDEEGAETQLLRDLIDNGNNLRIVSHDKVLGVATAGRDARNASQRYADSVAKAAVDAVRRSREEMAQQSRAGPRRRFGRSSFTPNSSFAGGRTQQALHHQQQPQQQQQQQQQQTPRHQHPAQPRAAQDEGFFGASVAGVVGHSVDNSSTSVLGNLKARTTAESTTPAERLAQRLLVFFRDTRREHPGRAKTEDIVAAFSESQDEVAARVLRSVLSKLAVLNRGTWSLRSDYL